MTTVHVPTARPYDVHIEAGCLDQAGQLIAQIHKPCVAALVADQQVYDLYGQRTAKVLEAAGFQVVACTFPAGERSKNLPTYAHILNRMASNHVSRGDLLVALGGGVTGDMAGFAAATYLRGIPFVQIPTTLLAAVDSSVGGKTAVDLEAGKNLVGCFYQPALVLCDPDLLQTLPAAEFRSGCAEVIKYGMLGDAGFFHQLAERPLGENLEQVIAACVTMKRDIVGQDELDRGLRQLLNLGHSIGHAVERCSNFSLAHGYAVSIGMTAITRAAVKRGLCRADALQQLLHVLQAYGLPDSTDYSTEDLLKGILSDKKISSGIINLIVPREVGRCEILPVPTGELAAWIEDGCRL